MVCNFSGVCMSVITTFKSLDVGSEFLLIGYISRDTGQVRIRRSLDQGKDHRSKKD